MADLPAGDAKLVQYLNEAYATEKRLETALQEHIGMALRPPYKKRLREHLTETKRHGREVKQAIKRLGGVAETISAPGPQPVTDVAQAVLGGAQKAAALAQGPLHALRGTGPEEKQLKNAKSEYSDESEEIAAYTAIETLAEALGNRDVQRLARSIRREEERMRSFLEREIAQLTKAVVKAEVPAAQRSAAKRSSASTRSAAAAPARGKRAAVKAAAATASGKRQTRKAVTGARKAAGGAEASTARQVSAVRKEAARKPAGAGKAGRARKPAARKAGGAGR